MRVVHARIAGPLALLLPVAPLLAAGTASCGAAPEVRPPVAAPCERARIGEVRVAGASPADVPALAVLEGTRDDAARVARVAAAAEEALRWRGFADARVAVAREPGCFTDLRVDVALGPRYRIAAIDFLTEDAFPPEARFAAIEDALGTVNAVGGVYIEYRLRRALAELERRYREAGWLDARIDAPRAAFGPDGGVRVAISVAAGPRYRIGTIRARGASPLLRRALLDELGLDPGAYYDAAAVRRGLARARRRLDRRVELRTRVAGLEGERGSEVEVELAIEGRR